MNREGTLYEIVHFVTVVAVAYVALLAARTLGIATLRGELLVMLMVGVTYVAVVLRLGLAPPSWRGDRPKD